MAAEEKIYKKRKVIIRILIAAVFLGAVHFLFRGPYLSNSIKRVLIPVLENVTGKRVIMDKAVINLFPFYLQGKSVKFIDEDGKRLLWITKSRIYIDLFALLSKEVRIRRLTLMEPNLTITDDELAEILDHVRSNISTPGKDQFKVSLMSLKLTEGKFTYTVSKDMNTFIGSGLYTDILVKDGSNFDIRLDKGTVTHEGLSGFDYKLKGKIRIKDNMLNASELVLSASESTIALSGGLSILDGRIGDGEFTGKAIVHESDICRIFNSERKTDGVVKLAGKVRMVTDESSEIPKFILDLETDGHFYLETLMDILKVRENIKGRLELDGRISGTFPDVIGKGNVNLNDAEFGKLSVKSGLGQIEYDNSRFMLTNFTAHAYDGSLSGHAHIDIPKGDFGVTASVKDVDSVQFMKYIGWDAPFSPGSISGNFDVLKIIGENINVDAFLSYVNTTVAEDRFIDRIKSVESDISFKDGVVSINNSRLSSLSTSFSLDGSIDINKNMLDMEVSLKGEDISDLTAPYYGDLKGAVSFEGRAVGPYESPVISGYLEMGPGDINGFMVSDASADISYGIKSLIIRSMTVNQSGSNFKLKGSIDFRESNKIFSFDSPYYNASISINNIPSESLADALFKSSHLGGALNGEIAFRGDSADFAGNGGLVITNGNIYGHDFDKMSFDIVLDPKKAVFKSVDLRKGGSNITGSGKIYYDKRFEISAISDKISSGDISYLAGKPFSSLFTLKLDGSGTFDNPDIRFYVGLMDSSISGVEVGDSEITGSIKGQRLNAKGLLSDKRITANASALLSGEPSWSLDVGFTKGRYDFLLAGLLKDHTQDLSAFLEGNIKMRSEKGKVSMKSKFGYLNLSLYGYDFRNNGDIILDLNDDDLSIRSFSLVGKDASLDIKGDVLLGESYNLSLEGDIDLLPLKVLTDKVTFLEGRGNFAVDINGNWDKPEIVGELNVTTAELGLKGFPHRIGPFDGKLFFNKDKVIFDSFKSHFAGGTVVLFGAGYLDGLSFSRLLISSEIAGVNLIPFNGVNAAFDGKLFFETASKGSSLTGEILLNKAQYKKDVDFKSMFQEIKEMDVVPSKLTWMDKMMLNIRIVGTENIVIDNNIAKTPVKVDLTMTGTAARYGLIGLVESKGGSIFFRGNEFSVLESSSVDFVSPDKISPVFHIKAETSSGGYRVKLNLDGPLDNFTLALFSEPHLSEVDILTLLSFGTVGTEGGGVEGGMAASQATSILTGGFQGEVNEGFKNITGFDRFEVSPHTTATGSLSPKITVGKHFLDDRLSVIYSTSVGSTEENVLRMEYDLGNNVSLVGSRDELGSSGADIKYKFKFK